MEIGIQKKVICTIGKEEKELTLQHPGIEYTLEMGNRNTDLKTGKPSVTKAVKDMLENVVIAPKLTMKDFASPKEVLEFYEVVDNFLETAE